jgi:hypothetical protein
MMLAPSEEVRNLFHTAVLDTVHRKLQHFLPVPNHHRS